MTPSQIVAILGYDVEDAVRIVDIDEHPVSRPPEGAERPPLRVVMPDA